MRKVFLPDLETGMKLARDVYLDDGRILLLAGFAIRPKYVQRLESYRIPFVYVEDTHESMPVPNEERIYEEAHQAMHEVMDNVREGNALDVAVMKQTVHEIVDSLLFDDTIFMNTTGIRDIDNYTYLHSVDVCIYSLITGKHMGLPKEELYELGLGAILHDIGKCRIPLEILNKPSRLTRDEYLEMMQHSQYGVDITHSTMNLSERIVHIIEQHHEKWDGSGYPAGLTGTKIERFARIVAVADVYDALTANRVYRKRYMPHEAAEYLMAQAEFQFDTDIIRSFLEKISIYRENMVVMLNTGEIARVLPARGVITLRPKVLVITRKDGPPVLAPYELDLATHPTTFINEILS